MPIKLIITLPLHQYHILLGVGIMGKKRITIYRDIWRRSSSRNFISTYHNILRNALGCDISAHHVV